jgi:uncharacterized membrane protein
MPARLRQWWSNARTSLWFPAALMTGAAAIASFVTLRIDDFLASQDSQLYFTFGGGAESARAVLTVIASSTITVTATVFSITIIALQLASSQYTPRIMRNFTRDRGNQVVLGALIGSFTYSLLILRTTHSFRAPDGTSVPALSVAMATLFALVSIALLIYYIHHAARLIQVSTIVDRAARDTLALVDRLFPDPDGTSTPDLAQPHNQLHVVRAQRAGYLQAVDSSTILGIPTDVPILVRMEQEIGGFVLPGTPLATIWPRTSADENTENRVRSGFILGPERSLDSDVAFGIRQLTDIAIRALSPGVNDPATAIQCIDRLAEVFVRFGQRAVPEREEASHTGLVHFVRRIPRFDHNLALAFDHIRHYGAADPRVAVHLLQTLGRVAAHVSREHRPAIAVHIERIRTAAGHTIDHPDDLAAVEAAARDALRRARSASIQNAAA